MSTTITPSGGGPAAASESSPPGGPSSEGSVSGERVPGTTSRSLPPTVKATLVALAPLAAAVITLLNVFDLVHWSAAQTALVTTETGAAIGLISALVAHLWPATGKEPVALAATLTAFAAATVALGSGFGWWSWTEQQTTAVVSVLSAVVGVGSALVARSVTSPKI